MDNISGGVRGPEYAVNNDTTQQKEEAAIVPPVRNTAVLQYTLHPKQTIDCHWLPFSRFDIKIHLQ